MNGFFLVCAALFLVGWGVGWVPFWFSEVGATVLCLRCVEEGWVGVVDGC